MPTSKITTSCSERGIDMGYVSDVAWRVRFNKDSPSGERLFNTFLAEVKSREDTRIAASEMKVDEEKMELSYHVESVKWYDDFAAVKSHQALWDTVEAYNKMDEEDNPDPNEDYEQAIDAAFVRIGEELDDNYQTYINCGYELLYITRSIEWG